MASTEDIEAKLCAYIEGVLDPVDKAEIEKHLEANPHHRVLLADLARTRTMVQELPREGAPDEILEAVQSHLERTALLQDSDAAAHSAMRINRLPQLLAMAAVLLLTVGLGVVIYYVLPRSNQAPNYAVVTAPSTTLPAAGSAAPGTDTFGDIVGDDFASAESPPAALAEQPPAASIDAFSETTPPPLAAPSAPAPPVDDVVDPAAGLPLAKGGIVADASAAAPEANIALAKKGESHSGIDFETAREQLTNADIARQLKTAPNGLKSNSLFVVVTTDNAVTTKDQVAGFLTTNSIEFNEVVQAPPQPLDLEESQRVLASRQTPAQEYRMKGGPASAAADAEAEKLGANTEGKEGAVGGAVSARRSESEPYTRDRAVADAVVDVPATQESVTGEDIRGVQQRLQVGQQAPVRPQTLATPGDLATELPQELIVARSMTRQQAEALHEALSNQTNVYRARLYDPPQIDSFHAAAEAGDRPKSYYNTLAEMLHQPSLDESAVVEIDKRLQIEQTLQVQSATTQPAEAPAAPDEVLDVVIVLKDPDLAPPISPAQQQAAPSIDAHAPSTAPATAPGVVSPDDPAE